MITASSFSTKCTIPTKAPIAGVIVESDTPRKTGGLLSWAASKAVEPVGLGVARLNSRLELSATIRGILLADVLSNLLQFGPYRGHRVAAGPEVFAGEIPLLSGKAVLWQSRSFPSGIQSRKAPGAWAGSRCTCAHDPALSAPPRSSIPSVSQRMENRFQLTADIPEDRFPSPFGNEHHMVLAVTRSPTWSGLGFDKRLTFDPPTSWSSSHWRRIILPERSNLQVSLVEPVAYPLS